MATVEQQAQKKPGVLEVPEAHRPGRRLRSVGAEVAKHGTLLFFSAMIIFPLVWVLLLSIKNLPDSYQNYILPQTGVDLSHYAYVWEHIPTLPRNMMNSVVVTLSTTVLTVICAVLGGYALVHLRTPGRAIVFALLVASLFFPVRVTGLIGVWEVQRNLGLLNTTWGLIPPYVGALPTLALGVFIMRGMFQTIPSELVQAARVDGAGSFKTLWYVLLPLVRNGMIVVALFTFVVAWGEYLLAATLTNDLHVRTLPLVLAFATGGMGQWAWPRIAAVYVMAIVPALVVFALVQGRFLAGLQEGALKE
jgi:ABC-type glycerol-3-phosphate transport system permease component